MDKQKERENRNIRIEKIKTMGLTSETKSRKKLYIEPMVREEAPLINITLITGTGATGSSLF